MTLSTTARLSSRDTSRATAFQPHGAMYRTVKAPSIRVRRSIRHPTCQIHAQGLVFRRVICGVQRVPGTEPSRIESKSQP